MIELMEETANMLRGVCMDPRVPQDTKEALWSRVRKLDAATEAALDDGACESDRERIARWLEGQGQPGYAHEVRHGAGA